MTTLPALGVPVRTGPTCSLLGSLAGAGAAGLLPVATDAHRAPVPRAVLGGVVERPLAFVRGAELQAYPGVVGLQVGHRRKEPGQAAPGAADRRSEPGTGAVEDDPERQGRGCRVEAGHLGRVVPLVVTHQRLAQPGPKSQREVEVAPLRPVVDVEQVALAEPVGQRSRVREGALAPRRTATPAPPTDRDWLEP